ncbi:MAG: RluA family pseudouridine synthase [Clostridia bacterium]
MKLYSFTIPWDAREGKLLPYVKRMLPELPDYAIREAFDKRDVKVNGRRAGRDETVLAGAEVKIYTRELARRSLLRFVYEDENLLVVGKPAGVSCEEDEKGGKTVVQLAYEQMLQGNPLAKEPLLCHRLDNPTDGLLLLAKNEDVQTALMDAFRQRQIHKSYTCLVRGTPDPSHEVLRAFLIKNASEARVYITPNARANALPIVTEYTVLEAGECARLHIDLHTGRTHQIRAHMAFIGHPLLGDDKYGDYAFNKSHKASRLMLTATELHFELEGALQYLNAHTFTYPPEF